MAQPPVRDHSVHRARNLVTSAGSAPETIPSCRRRQPGAGVAHNGYVAGFELRVLPLMDGAHTCGTAGWQRREERGRMHLGGTALSLDDHISTHVSSTGGDELLRFVPSG